MRFGRELHPYIIWSRPLCRIAFTYASLLKRYGCEPPSSIVFDVSGRIAVAQAALSKREGPHRACIVFLETMSRLGLAQAALQRRNEVNRGLDM